MPQTPGEAVITINHNRIHESAPAIGKQAVELRAALFDTAHTIRSAEQVGFGVRIMQKYLSILQAALKMGCCPQTAKRIFKDRPGVGKYPGKNGRIYYRIPMDVFIRVDQEYRGLVKCAAE